MNNYAGELREEINKVLSTLNPREQRVLQLRFGLEDGQSRTLQKVGEELNVTRERIRQIEARALRRLRHPSRRIILENFLPIVYERPAGEILLSYKKLIHAIFKIEFQTEPGGKK